jgi:hypothetical protein
MTEPSVGVELTTRHRIALRLRALGWTSDLIAERLSARRLISGKAVAALLAEARVAANCPTEYDMAVWTVDRLLAPQERARWVGRATALYANLLKTKSEIRLRLLTLATDPVHYASQYADFAVILRNEFPDDNIKTASVNAHMSHLCSVLGEHRGRLKLVTVCHLSRGNEE